MNDGDKRVGRFGAADVAALRAVSRDHLLLARVQELVQDARACGDSGWATSRAGPLRWDRSARALSPRRSTTSHPRWWPDRYPTPWSFASIDDILEARLEGVHQVLFRILGDRLDGQEIEEAAYLAESAVADTDAAGRPLFAANADLSVPREPHLRLWWALTCLREHRGDGHVAALVNAGLDGCEAHVTLSATGVVARSTLQPNRGWTDEEWSHASDRLRSRGLLDDEERLTTAGRSARDQLERDTDRLASQPWRKLGADRTERLAGLLRPLTKAVVKSGEIPVPNPMGLRPT